MLVTFGTYRVTKGTFHLSQLTGQTISIATIISLLIKTLQPDQSNPILPAYY